MLPYLLLCFVVECEHADADEGGVVGVKDVKAFGSELGGQEKQRACIICR